MSTMPRKVPAAKLTGHPLSVAVTVERNVGTFTGYDAELSALRRFLEYQVTRFGVRAGLTGRWGLLVYVTRRDDP